MSYTCPVCGCSSVLRRNGVLQCARCGSPAQIHSPEEELSYEQNLERGRALLRARRYSEAAPIYRDLRRLRPDDPQVYLNLARSLTDNFAELVNSDEVISALTSARALGAALPGEALRWMQDLMSSAQVEVSRQQDRILGWTILAFLAVAAFWVFVALSQMLLCLLMTVGLWYCIKNIRQFRHYLTLARARASALRERLRL